MAVGTNPPNDTPKSLLWYLGDAEEFVCLSLLLVKQQERKTILLGINGRGKERKIKALFGFDSSFKRYVYIHALQDAGFHKIS